MMIVFLVLALLSLLSAFGVIFFRNPIYSVLSLIVCFFSIAGHYLLLQAEFLAVVQVIVYAGAIMVLFLFIIMLLNLSRVPESKKPLLFRLVAILTSGVLLVSLVLSLTTICKPQSFCPFLSQGVMPQIVSKVPIMTQLATLLFNEYLFPFEFSSLLFLAAVVGVVVLSKKTKDIQS